MTTLEVLVGVKRLLNRPERWIKYALSRYDQRTQTRSYCILGAMGEICEGDYSFIHKQSMLPIISKVAKVLRIAPQEVRQPLPEALLLKYGLAEWNNASDMTYEKLIDRIDRGIKRCQSRYGHRVATPTRARQRANS